MLRENPNAQATVRGILAVVLPGADDACVPKRKRESDDGGKLMHNSSKRTRADGETGLEGIDTDARDRRRLDRYMVGWICAMGTEYVAAQELPDEEHDAPDFVSPNDANHYTCGRLGKHDVVIAVPPDGEYGTSSAAQVATNMQQSFPNIRIVVMVGTGGGAPSSKHDIRLGDIVVSAPHAGGGGVFQYDFDETTRDLAFRRVRFLNQLPKPEAAAEYSRPAPDTDRLFEKVTDGAGGCSSTLPNVVPRRERTKDEDNPAIHYGLIASANHLIKDAMIRDGLTADKDVLCFKTEAAGLMDRFPCVVIRGICDYSDSHANKEWQGYAAMVAAAYAKDLLGQIAPNRIWAEKKICDILPGIGTDAAEQRGDVKEFVPKHSGGGAERMSAQEQNRHRPVRHASAAGPWDGKRETSAALATGFSSAAASDHG
ncbi:putative G-protein beta WD-40 repeat containing protein [Metarhizium anisopliae]